MPGVPGAGGPPPKPSNQRRRANPTAGEARMGGATQAIRGELVIPEPDEDWHPVARQWFVSLGSSGQAASYESSDWAVAAALAEALSRELKPQPMVVGSGEFARVEMVEQPMKSATLAAFLKGCTALLATEGDRRRAAVEMQARRSAADDAEKPASVTDMRSWKAGLNA